MKIYLEGPFQKFSEDSFQPPLLGFCLFFVHQKFAELAIVRYSPNPDSANPSASLNLMSVKWAIRGLPLRPPSMDIDPSAGALVVSVEEVQKRQRVGDDVNADDAEKIESSRAPTYFLAHLTSLFLRGRLTLLQ